MLAILAWLVPALVPALLVGALVYVSDRRREPVLPVVGTFLLGVVTAAAAFFIERRAAAWTGLDDRTGAAGNAGLVLFLFAFAAPVREAAKVAACWPAFRSRHFDEPYDGIVYASTAALGFAALQNVLILRLHPASPVWILRTVLALLAHLFFAALWGYALGRAKQSKDPGALFPAAWLAATLGHALYTHLVYGRGPGALVAVIPMLLVMGGIAAIAARDLRVRSDRAVPSSGEHASRLSRPSLPMSIPQPPSLRTMRDALTRSEGHPIMLRWIVYGALVTLGAMLVGLAATVAFGHWAHVDFATVDEHDATTTGPVALLGSGLLAAFPVSGFLVARASSLPTLLEPALATAVAIVLTLLVLGLAAPVALVFALAFSPVAFVLACAGAWVGRPVSAR